MRWEKKKRQERTTVERKGRGGQEVIEGRGANVGQGGQTRSKCTADRENTCSAV